MNEMNEKRLDELAMRDMTDMSELGRAQLTAEARDLYVAMHGGEQNLRQPGRPKKNDERVSAFSDYWSAKTGRTSRTVMNLLDRHEDWKNLTPTTEERISGTVVANRPLLISRIAVLSEAAQEALDLHGDVKLIRSRLERAEEDEGIERLGTDSHGTKRRIAAMAKKKPAAWTKLQKAHKAYMDALKAFDVEFQSDVLKAVEALMKKKAVKKAKSAENEPEVKKKAA
jgi:hypothetical protein